jgi:serine/threonine-protein kinase
MVNDRPPTGEGVTMARLLAGRYELAAPIGHGPTGTVWSARDTGTREHLAVKVLDPELTADQHIVDRFERERYVLTAFLHPSYVRVRDVVVEDRLVALVTELVDGTDLRGELGRWHPMEPATAVGIAATVAEALAEGHDTGVVHCDVKPSNLIIADATREVRITDCRVARLARGYGTGSGRFATPEYVAPEVILGGPPVPSSDVYALGLVLYEMLTGVLPYRAGDPEESLALHLRAELLVPTWIPGELRRLVEACTRIDERIRPTAAQLAHALRRLAPELAGLGPMEPLPPGSRLLQPVHREPEPGAPPPARPAPARRPLEEPVAPAPAPPARRPIRQPPSNVRIVAVAAGALVVATVAILVVRTVASDGGTQTGPGAATRPASQRGNATATDTRVTGPPAAAQPATVDGAAAFVNYWVDTLNKAVGSGDTAVLEAASSPNCKPCTAAAQVMKTGHTNGGTFRGGAYTVREVTTDSFFNVERPVLRLVFDRAPRSTISADGRQVQVFPGATFLTCQLVLERVQDRWRVLDVQTSAPIA